MFLIIVSKHLNCSLGPMSAMLLDEKGPYWPPVSDIFGPEVVHNCTIFLCSLDVRNIVQGGDPLYAVFFLHRALEAILNQNGCGFLQKTPAYSVEA